MISNATRASRNSPDDADFPFIVVAVTESPPLRAVGCTNKARPCTSGIFCGAPATWRSEWRSQSAQSYSRRIPSDPERYPRRSGFRRTCAEKQNRLISYRLVGCGTFLDVTGGRWSGKRDSKNALRPVTATPTSIRLIVLPTLLPTASLPGSELR